jgi:hypothetical protein
VGIGDIQLEFEQEFQNNIKFARAFFSIADILDKKHSFCIFIRKRETF